MTATVSKNKVPIGIIAIGVVAIILIAMGASTMNNSEITVSPSSTNMPETSPNDLPSASVKTDPAVFDKNHAKHLLDEKMLAVTSDPQMLKLASDHILMRIKSTKSELVWHPEKVAFTEGKGFKEDVLYFGLDGSINEFYAGPVVRWWQKEPGSTVEYEVAFVAMTGGSFLEWGETPYKYGVEAYADPPPEVLKVFSDNGAILHY